MSSKPARSQGFSLVEVMIAITLGLLLLAGLIRLFVSSKQGYRLQESTGRLQENARFATDYLATSVRQADFWGGVEGDSVVDLGGIADDSVPCSLNWMATYTTAIQGWAGGTTTPLAGCTGGDYVVDSDVLVLRFADPESFLNTTDLATTPVDELSEGGNLFIRSQVGAGGVLFDVANRDDAIAEIPGEDAEAVFNYRYSALVFYLDRGDTGTPTLYRKSIADGTVISQPLVDGVEQMKFLYGLDSNGDGSVDSYREPAGMTPSDWQNVSSVRATVIVRGDQLDEFTDTEDYPMTPEYTYSVSAGEERYQRRLFVEDIQIRNRNRS